MNCELLTLRTVAHVFWILLYEPGVDTVESSPLTFVIIGQNWITSVTDTVNFKTFSRQKHSNNKFIDRL